MPSHNVQICNYTSDDPRGQFLELMRFVKQELRGIGVKAQDRGHHCTANLSEEAVAVLDKMWNKAIHECKNPAEPSLSERGGHRTTEVSDYTMLNSQ